MKKYDFVIIGSGSGGGTAAILAAQHKTSVALIEGGNIGGTNLHWGCIPIKSLVSSSKMFQHARHGEDYGVNIPQVNASLATWTNRERLVVAKLAEEMDRSLRKHGITVLRGTASFETENTIRIHNDKSTEIIEGRKIIIATGSVPFTFENTSAESRKLVGTSNDFVHLTHLPPRLLIVGGGYIGCELCGIYSSLGSQITLVEGGSHLLPELETEAGDYLQKKFEQSGVRVILNTKVTGVTHSEDGNRAVAQLDNGQTIEEDRILVAVGRHPNLDDLNLDIVGISHDRAIIVNDQLQTNLRHVYAIGDCNGRCALAHSAFAQAEVAVLHAIGESATMDFRHIPFCVLTNPEITAVGLNEESAVKQGIPIKVSRCSFRSVGRALAMGELDGFVKLVAEEHSGRILGGLIIGSNASELIPQIVLALKFGATAHQLAHMTCPRPSLSEAIQEAARRLISDPLNSL
jgi:dihydrolipoamide dehydrogenase